MSYMNYNRNDQPTKLDQNAGTNLDQDLANSRSVRYDNNQMEVKQYLQNILKTEFPDLLSRKFGQEFGSIDLMEILKDGEVLCKLGSLLPKSKFPSNPSSKFKNSRMPFIQMENISFFLLACELIGMPHDEIFQTVDLYESKDPYQVIVTLMSFSRIVNQIDSLIFPVVIGPKSSRVKPPVPNKPYKLRDGK